MSGLHAGGSMPMMKRLGLLSFGSLAILIGSSANATSFAVRPMGTVVDEAPVIIRGKAQDSRTEWSQPSEAGKKIYTYTDILVDEVLKGDVSQKTIQVREIGGEKDGVTLEVPGAARFKHGDDVVLMLSNPASDGAYPLLGLSTGKYSVTRDASGNEVLVGASSHDPYPGSNFGVQNDTSGMKKWSLNDLRQWVHRPGQPQESTSEPKKSQENQDLRANPSERQHLDGTTAPPLLHSSDVAGSSSPMTGDSKLEASSHWKVILAAIALAAVLIGIAVRRRK